MLAPVSDNQIETEIDRNDEQFRTIVVTFYNKNWFCMQCSSAVINQLAFVECMVVLAVGTRFYGHCRYGVRLN